MIIKNKKGVESSELPFDAKGQKHLINNKEGESSNNEDSPSWSLL